MDGSAAIAIRHAIRPRPARDPLDEVESRDKILSALATLTQRQRISLVLTDLLDYSSEEAGRLMGLSSTTVRVLPNAGRSPCVHGGGKPDAVLKDAALA